MKIIITDLTRFKNLDKVCIAGVSRDGTVIRPLPYLAADQCQKLDIHPGGILEGDFVLNNSTEPHVEDASYDSSKLYFHGACSKREFRDVLERTLYSSLSDGFGVDVQSREKCLPASAAPLRSLITIKVNPLSLSIVQDSYNPERLKAHFSDGAGVELAFVGVTDRGFYDYAQRHRDDPTAFIEMKRFIQSQKELYLRIGLSRAYQSPDGRNGYWIQLNGIYTFPNKLEYVRCYDCE